MTRQLRAGLSKPRSYKSRICKGFVGYGDADPSNVSLLVHGAEMRVAETRAVNRALRKAYGIGICSVEELGSLCRTGAVFPGSRRNSLLSPQTGTTVAPKFAIASARSSASISSMPLWSRPTPLISAGRRLCVKLPVSRSRTSSRIWPIGPRKTAMPYSCQLNSYFRTRKVPREAPLPGSSRSRSISR